ncbi:MAG TPA: PadR family transcriptional regulator [Anaerolineae bacterium]|nr:PadR family transcriptional regulator [Anaerolineae bacterium]
MSEQDTFQEQLPLTEATFFILLSLTSGRKHGYVIMKDVERLSDGRVALSTGTLYGALGRLLDHGWIERVEEDQTSGRPRKAYVLSDLGQSLVSAETERLKMLLNAAQGRLLRGEA